MLPARAIGAMLLACAGVGAGAGADGAFFARPAQAQKSRDLQSLPPDVRFDILRLELFEAARKKRHKEVLQLSDRLRKTGRKIPAETPYLEAQAFYALGAAKMARGALVIYLRETGRKGAHYDEAVRLFVKIKTAQDELKREADARAALRADFTTLRAAWKAEQARRAAWKKRAVVFGGPGADSATDMARARDGGIVVAGAFHVRKAPADTSGEISDDSAKKIEATLPWITAFDARGRRIWHRPLGTATDAGNLRSVVPLPGRGYLFGGTQKGFQMAAVTDRLGNMVANGDGDPWIIGFAPSRVGDGGIARLLHSGDIIAFGAEAIGTDEKTGKPTARLPVAVRLSPQGKVLGKAVLGRSGGTLWFDVKDAVVLDSGDVVIAGETRHVPSGINGAGAAPEGYLIRVGADGHEKWIRRVAAGRRDGTGDGLSITTLTLAHDGAVIAAGRDGDRLAVFRFTTDGDLVWRKTFAAQAVDRTAPAIAKLCGEKDLAGRLAAAYGDGSGKDNDATKPGADEIRTLRDYACPTGKPFAAATALSPRDGGYLVLGIDGWQGDRRTRITLTAIDETGAMVWQQATAALPDTLATAALPTGDGGFVVSGVTTNWGRDVLLFKTDSRGRIAAFTDLAPKVQPPVKKPKPAKKPEKTEPAPKTGVMPDDTRPPVVSDDKAPVRPDHVSEKAPEKAPVKNEAAKSSATGTATTNSVKAEDRPAANSTGGADTPEYDLFDLLGGIFNSSPADGNGEGAPNKADGGNKQPSAAQGNTVSPRR